MRERMILPLMTPRLELRKFTEEDTAALHAIVAPPEVREHLGWDPPPEARTRAFVRAAMALDGENPRPAFVLAVLLGGTDRLIGSCEVRTRDPRGRAGEVRLLLEAGSWGRGLGTEVLQALLGLGFEGLGLHRLWATVRPGDARARRVLEKAGFHFEGYLQKDQWMERAWEDSYLFALTEEAWGGTSFFE
jgi:[ribosomal protein S5]-alanine N-acetyltransferase